MSKIEEIILCIKGAFEKGIFGYKLSISKAHYEEYFDILEISIKQELENVNQNKLEEIRTLSCFAGESLHHRIVPFDNWGKKSEKLTLEEERQIDFLIIITSVFRSSDSLQKIKDDMDISYKDFIGDLNDLINKFKITNLGNLAFALEKEIEYFERIYSEV